MRDQRPFPPLDAGYGLTESKRALRFGGNDVGVALTFIEQQRELKQVFGGGGEAGGAAEVRREVQKRWAASNDDWCALLCVTLCWCVRS